MVIMLGVGMNSLNFITISSGLGGRGSRVFFGCYSFFIFLVVFSILGLLIFFIIS